MSKGSKFSDLENNLHVARTQINDAIAQLAETAIQDSVTYQEAIKKLRDYGWKLFGKSSDFMIDSAIEFVKERAMKSKV